MGLVVFEAKERDRAHVSLGARTIGLLDGEDRVVVGVLLDLESIAVLVIIAAHVAGEGVAAIGPPEPGAFVGIEG